MPSEIEQQLKEEAANIKVRDEKEFMRTVTAGANLFKSVNMKDKGSTDPLPEIERPNAAPFVEEKSSE